MAYNPNLYNPYGMQQMQPQFPQPFQQQQPVNGLKFIDVNNIDSYQLPPGSVSDALFVDDKHFIIKTFDNNGGSSIEAYEANKIPLSSLLKPNDMSITKADLDAFKAEIMEVINGKHSIADVPAAATTDPGTAAPDPERIAER